MSAFNNNFVPEMVIMGSVLALILFLPIWCFYRRYLGLKVPSAMLLMLVAFGAMLGTIAYRASESVTAPFGVAPEVRLPILGAGLLWLVLIPFALRLYFAWMEGNVTEVQKRTDAEGVRAWLRGGNAVCAAGIALFTWAGFGYSFWAVLFLCLVALLAYPAVNILKEMPEAPASRGETLSAEREKVFALLEDKRISAEEAADLMSALGETVRPRDERAVPAPLGLRRKLVLLGGALVLVGFFLPWFSVDLGQEMSRMAGQQQQVFQQFQQTMGAPNAPTPNLSALWSDGSVVQVMGGDIRHGIGWIILIVGLGVAALPLLRTDLEPGLVKKVSLIALAIGVILALYLLTQNPRWVSAGLILVLIGYGMEAWNVLRSEPSPRI